MTGAESLDLYFRCQSPALPDREQAYQDLGRMLYAIVWRRVAGRPELEPLAAECMQEALLIIWQRIEAGQGPREPERFVGWCAVIVINKLRERLRQLEPKTRVRRSKRIGLSRLSSLDAPIGDGAASLGDRLAVEQAELDEQQAYREIQALVQEIQHIDAISEQSRTVLLKGFIEGMDDQELAELLGTSRANVHVIRHRDLVKLRQAGDFIQRLRALYEDG